jgi:hypothetical protein
MTDINPIIHAAAQRAKSHFPGPGGRVKSIAELRQLGAEVADMIAAVIEHRKQGVQAFSLCGNVRALAVQGRLVALSIERGWFAQMDGGFYAAIYPCDEDASDVILRVIADAERQSKHIVVQRA